MGQLYPLCVHCGRAMKDAPKVYVQDYPTEFEITYTSKKAIVVDSEVLR